MTSTGHARPGAVRAVLADERRSPNMPKSRPRTHDDVTRRTEPRLVDELDEDVLAGCSRIHTDGRQAAAPCGAILAAEQERECVWMGGWALKHVQPPVSDGLLGAPRIRMQVVRRRLGRVWT